MGKWGSRTPLNLLPNRSCMPWGLRAVEGKDLGTSSSLARTVAGIQVRHKKQEIDTEQRFMSGT